MLQRMLCIVALLMPLIAQAQQASDISKYLLGEWQVESVKEHNDKAFHPPRHSIKWVFNRDGTMVEVLGKNGAKIHWHYRVSGREIKVQLRNMAFNWRVLSMEPGMMLVRHQLGLFKVKRLSAHAKRK